MRHANIKGDAGLWNLITSPELRNLGLPAALPKLRGSSGIKSAKGGWKQGGTSRTPWQRTGSQLPGTCQGKLINVIIKQNWGKWSFKRHKSLSQGYKTSSALKQNGEGAPCWRKTPEKKTSLAFLYLRDLVLVVQLQCLASLLQIHCQQWAAWAALCSSPDEMLCNSSFWPSSSETLLILAGSPLTEGMSARAFAQSHSTGHNRSEYQSYCPAKCCSCWNTQCLIFGK